jgi:hypothetical protein
MGAKASVLTAPAAVTRVLTNREENDCAVVAMAMFSGHSYEDVLREVVICDPKHRGRIGLTDYQTRRVMRALGAPVRHRRAVDYDEDFGLLRLHDHMALLRNGLIIENGAIWDVADWRIHAGYQDDTHVMGIFVAAE